MVITQWINFKNYSRVEYIIHILKSITYVIWLPGSMYKVYLKILFPQHWNYGNVFSILFWLNQFDARQCYSCVSLLEYANGKYGQYRY